MLVNNASVGNNAIVVRVERKKRIQKENNDE